MGENKKLSKATSLGHCHLGTCVLGFKILVCTHEWNAPRTFGVPTETLYLFSLCLLGSAATKANPTRKNCPGTLRYRNRRCASVFFSVFVRFFPFLSVFFRFFPVFFPFLSVSFRFFRFCPFFSVSFRFFAFLSVFFRFFPFFFRFCPFFFRFFPFFCVSFRFFPFSSVFFRFFPFFPFFPFSSVFFRFLPFFPFHFQKKTGRHRSRDPFCETPRRAQDEKKI